MPHTIRFPHLAALCGASLLLAACATPTLSDPDVLRLAQSNERVAAQWEKDGHPEMARTYRERAARLRAEEHVTDSGYATYLYESTADGVVDGASGVWQGMKWTWHGAGSVVSALNPFATAPKKP